MCHSLTRRTCPGGTMEKSRAMDRWEPSRHRWLSPVGTIENRLCHQFQPSLRDWDRCGLSPSDSSIGFYTSLWDGFSLPSRRKKVARGGAAGGTLGRRPRPQPKPVKRACLSADRRQSVREMMTWTSGGINETGWGGGPGSVAHVVGWANFFAGQPRVPLRCTLGYIPPPTSWAERCVETNG